MSEKRFPLNYIVKVSDDAGLNARDGFTLARFVNASDAINWVNAYAKKEKSDGFYRWIRVCYHNTVIVERTLK